MRVASRVLLIIGAVVSIICALTFLILGGVFSAVGSLSLADIEKGIQEGTINTGFEGTVSEQAEAVKLLFTVLGAMFLVFGIACIPNAVFAFIGMGRRGNGVYVCNIIFGVLSGTAVTILGGIFGVIAPRD